MGCAHESESLKPSFKARSEFFNSDYDKIWRAVQRAISAYPLKVNNMDKGILETTTIEGESLYSKPHRKRTSKTSAIKYSLKFNLVKGNMGDKSAVKVIIKKTKFHTSNFFSGKKELASDGLEEQAILYRIKRELQVEQILERVAE